MAIEIKIGASFNDRDIKRAQRELQNLATVAGQSSQSLASRLEATGKRLSSFGESMTKKVTLPLVGIAALSVKAFMEQEDAIANMEASLQSTGGVAGVTSQHIQDLAGSLQKTTTFADEVTVGGAALLLTFKNVRNEMGAGNDVFDRTIKAAQDLSAKMGTDLNSSVMLLGKALQDPEKGLTRLTRAGVQFSEQQEQQIRAMAQSGDVLGAQRIMLEELESQFGGTAEAMARTASGRLKVAMNQLGEAGEAIGAQLAPAISKAAELISGFGAAFAELPGPIQAVVVGFGAIVTAAGPLIWAVGTVVEKTGALMKVDWVGGFNRAKDTIANFATSLQAGFGQAIAAFRNMSTGAKVAMAGVTVALVGAGIALNYFVNEQAENARRRFKTLGVSVDSLRTSFQLLVSDNALVGGLEDLPTVLRDIQTETEGAYNWFVRLRLSGENGEIGFASGWFTSVDDNAAAARESIAAWDAQLAAIDVSQGVAQFQALSAQAEALGYSLPLDMFPQLKSNIETAAAAAGMSVDDFLKMAGAGGEIKTEFEQATEALEDWEAEVRSQFNPLFAYGDSLDKVAQAQKRQQEAALKAMAAVADHGEGSSEAIAAIADYQAAVRGTTDATLDAYFQVEELKAGLRTGSIDFITAAGHLDGLVAAGLMTEEQARLTKEEWARLAGQVITTPDSKDITITSNVGSILQMMERLRDLIAGSEPGLKKNLFQYVESKFGGVGNAGGGPVMGGVPGWVGERGPELFIPKVDGTIVPHYQSRRIMDELGRGQGQQPQAVPPRGDVNVYVNKTDANPYDIGRELLWTMKVAG